MEWLNRMDGVLGGLSAISSCFGGMYYLFENVKEEERGLEAIIPQATSREHQAHHPRTPPPPNHSP